MTMHCSSLSVLIVLVFQLDAVRYTSNPAFNKVPTPSDNPAGTLKAAPSGTSFALDNDLVTALTNMKTAFDTSCGAVGTAQYSGATKTTCETAMEQIETFMRTEIVGDENALMTARRLLFGPFLPMGQLSAPLAQVYPALAGRYKSMINAIYGNNFSSGAFGDVQTLLDAGTQTTNYINSALQSYSNAIQGFSGTASTAAQNETNIGDASIDALAANFSAVEGGVTSSLQSVLSNFQSTVGSSLASVVSQSGDMTSDLGVQLTALQNNVDSWVSRTQTAVGSSKSDTSQIHALVQASNSTIYKNLQQATVALQQSASTSSGAVISQLESQQSNSLPVYAQGKLSSQVSVTDTQRLSDALNSAVSGISGLMSDFNTNASSVVSGYNRSLTMTLPSAKSSLDVFLTQLGGGLASNASLEMNALNRSLYSSLDSIHSANLSYAEAVSAYTGELQKMKDDMTNLLPDVLSQVSQRIVGVGGSVGDTLTQFNQGTGDAINGQIDSTIGGLEGSKSGAASYYGTALGTMQDQSNSLSDASSATQTGYRLAGSIAKVGFDSANSVTAATAGAVAAAGSDASGVITEVQTQNSAQVAEMAISGQQIMFRVVSDQANDAAQQTYKAATDGADVAGSAALATGAAGNYVTGLTSQTSDVNQNILTASSAVDDSGRSVDASSYELQKATNGATSSIAAIASGTQTVVDGAMGSAGAAIGDAAQSAYGSTSQSLHTTTSQIAGMTSGLSQSVNGNTGQVVNSGVPTAGAQGALDGITSAVSDSSDMMSSETLAASANMYSMGNSSAMSNFGTLSNVTADARAAMTDYQNLYASTAAQAIVNGISGAANLSSAMIDALNEESQTVVDMIPNVLLPANALLSASALNLTTSFGQGYSNIQSSNANLDNATDYLSNVTSGITSSSDSAMASAISLEQSWNSSLASQYASTASSISDLQRNASATLQNISSAASGSLGAITVAQQALTATRESTREFSDAMRQRRQGVMSVLNSTITSMQNTYQQRLLRSSEDFLNAANQSQIQASAVHSQLADLQAKANAQMNNYNQSMTSANSVMRQYASGLLSNLASISSDAQTSAAAQGIAYGSALGSATTTSSGNIVSLGNLFGNVLNSMGSASSVLASSNANNQAGVYQLMNRIRGLSSDQQRAIQTALNALQTTNASMASVVAGLSNDNVGSYQHASDVFSTFASMLDQHVVTQEAFNSTMYQQAAAMNVSTAISAGNLAVTESMALSNLTDEAAQLETLKNQYTGSDGTIAGLYNSTDSALESAEAAINGFLSGGADSGWLDSNITAASLAANSTLAYLAGNISLIQAAETQAEGSLWAAVVAAVKAGV